MEKYATIGFNQEFDIVLSTEKLIAIRIIDYLSAHGTFKIQQKDVSSHYGLQLTNQIIELKIRVDLLNATPVRNFITDVILGVDLQEVKY